jgi:hypothetical protein
LTLAPPVACQVEVRWILDERRHDHAEAHPALALGAFVLDVEIHAPVHVLRDEA